MGTSFRQLLAGPGLAALQSAPGVRVARLDVKFLPPIPDADKIFGVGFNYRGHAAETGTPLPKYPSLFMRFNSSQVGHEQPVLAPSISTQFDYEGELAVIIGKPAWRIASLDAMQYVAGYSCFAENSVRDFQGHARQATAGKNFLASGAFGPWLVTADEIPDPTTLELTTRLNGTVMQHTTLADLVFSIPQLIEYVSSFTRLLPGDVISTGTPDGVGFLRKPPVFLQPGDLVEIDIPTVGVLRNRVIAEAEGVSAAGDLTSWTVSPASDDLIWLTEAQVASLVGIDAAMGALRTGFLEEAAGNASSVPKALGTLPTGAMHALGSMMPARGFAGFKTWAHTTAGATAIFSLFDTRNGRLLAVLEAATLGQIRTAAVSGLGADVLAAPDADELALIGTGAQALTQVAAVASVRPLKRLRVFSPNAEHRAAFVKRARDSFAFEVRDCGSLEEATRDAPIVTLITRTQKPFLRADMVAAGALVIAAGAILPTNAELFPDVLERAGNVVVDDLSNAQSASRELIDYFGSDPNGWNQVSTLGAVLTKQPLAASTKDIKVFKPMGTGLSDLSVAIMAYEAAQREHLGLHIKQPRAGDAHLARRTGLREPRSDNMTDKATLIDARMRS